MTRGSPERYMRLAIREAEKGLGRTSPNPAVGAVIVKGGRVVARGHHARAGGPHAEADALAKARESVRGADLYTTLEPCDHHGRTPPCSAAILAAGIRRVFVGSQDPNPLVDGRGIHRLTAGGVEVVRDVLRDECDALNAHWFRYITAHRPFVTLKAAVSLDGRLATRTGDSRWVSGAEARALVHQLRDRVDAVLVGAGTARSDDPRLTTRLPRGRGRDPLRIVLDTGLTLPPTLRLFRQRSAAPTIVAHASRGTRELGRNVELLRCRRAAGGVDLRDLLRRLGARGVTHLLVEGGAAVHGSFLRAGLVDRVALFVSPRIVGGDGLGWVGGAGVARMADALRLEDLEVEQVGEDLLVTGEPAGALASRRGRD